MCGTGHQREGVGHSRKKARARDLFVGEGEKSLPQGQEVSGQVAAVHAGDIVRPQRLERLRVVPVVEMAAMALQGFHGVHGIGRAFDQSTGRDETEVVGGQVGKQG